MSCAEQQRDGGGDLVDEECLDARERDDDPDDDAPWATERLFRSNDIWVLDLTTLVRPVPDVHSLFIQEETRDDERAEDEVQ